MADWLQGALQAAQNQLKDSVEEASKIINTAQVEFNFDDMAKEEEEEEKLAELYYDSDNVDGNDGCIVEEVIHEERPVFEERREEIDDNNIRNHRMASKTTAKSISSVGSSSLGNINSSTDKTKGKKVIQLLDVSGFDFDDDDDGGVETVSQQHGSSAVDVVGAVAAAAAAISIAAMDTADTTPSTHKDNRQTNYLQSASRSNKNNNNKRFHLILCPHQ